MQYCKFHISIYHLLLTLNDIVHFHSSSMDQHSFKITFPSIDTDDTVIVTSRDEK